ncbi:hypothetical protein COCSUDRAFT_62309 [Coccomyxa subellipsoidea C-169]|uniref:Uncharacterized protein n=1 Tax=Coccomyxa subellipsoidea (strain C-169) TaxID=574566 RepID=I0Z2N1_COCSC|nr:hypothetical protein COCSUDRAFT_62309 [Coccomyxa subellipsoidea C-169]EIE24900.1 hypothetical protein COCSUDRAFT_62309 [Coccomyxa subellipsoidea C-169]|eukprot:XP_005649444.1 hypothetical protein COCSUDRAFT_62309 [Coccomyxa subellipsoidea C-169]
MPRNGKTTSSDISGQLSALAMRLHVCLMTADLWGLPTASSTATAFGLLAGALGADPSLEAGGCGCVGRVSLKEVGL